jgi:general secretion pathway protein D
VIESNVVKPLAPRLSLLALACLLSACAPLVPQLPPAMQPGETTRGPADLTLSDGKRELRVEAAPTPPQAAQPSTGPFVEQPKLNDATLAAVNLQQVPLASFVQLIYAEVLKKNVNLHPQVLQRQDPITFRAGEGQTAGQVEQAVRLLLKSYGLSVVDVGGLTRVMPDNAALGDLPTIRYGAATPELPLSLQPVFHLITLQAVRQVDVVNWLRTMFGDRITVMDDAGRNAVLLRGTPDNVKAAMDAIAALDQPAMKGRASLALTPAYWSADELARRLAEVLSAEGYAVHPVGNPVTSGALRSPIILLPVAAINAVYVFTTTESVATHVANWARTLDRPSESGIGKNYFTYAVKHKDAELLAATLNRILSPGAAAGGVPAQGNAQAQAQQLAAARTSAVVVDKSTNTLIFQSRPDEYAQLASLLQTLDRPSKSALIEVTVAELALDNNREIGVDLLASRIEAGGGYRVGTQGSGTATANLNIAVFNGLNVPKLAISALASNNRATILSSPRLMARNGEAAIIQVGQEVPVISQQQSTGANNQGVLQTVQYRSTGVILRIKPVIHSGDQIDLDVVQEVSDARQTLTGVTASPTFQTRKVETKLTLRHGATVLLGGLISENGDDNNGGVPFLKDIPVLGTLFSQQKKSGKRTELIVLITPYIANDTHDAEAITEAFRKQLGAWAGGVQPAALPKVDAATPSKPLTVAPPATTNDSQ